MDRKYRHTKTTVSFVCYHFVFCPRYRRRIFDIPGVEDRFRQLVRGACEESGIEILELLCGEDYVYMHVNALPEKSIPDIMNIVKGSTSSVLREEFAQLGAMPGLWTRNYLVSTAETIDAGIIDGYVSSQKTRP
jgi:putative transposase